MDTTSAAPTGRAADAVVAALEARIASGDLVDSEPLPAERDLMKEFGASRTVIREAISALNTRGLIESRPRFRPIVRKPGYDAVLQAAGKVVPHLLTQDGGIRNLYDSRVFLERALVREAAVAATRDDIAALRAALVANEAAIPDSLAFYRTDTAFHGTLYAMRGNPIYPAIHEGYTNWLAPHWEKMLRSPERNHANYLAHKAIFDAILERDPDAADAALRRHLTAAWDYVSVTFDLE
ncbi:FCD domain-containing protein [Jannaschia sp. M317]|uniref:FCD domain-containing protein n=1 Tax=Jannaschia sp. M317 TaxID=2867011 RepID=UPI0021A3C269|nr:FCD domain-containing protein [Jannaschia sp. M317]UWQ19918.1 FCD domain-containing protein [Jannaschia sp. M317]